MDTSRPGLTIVLDGTCGCGRVSSSGRRQLMAADNGQLWLVDTGDPSRRHIPLPDFVKDPSGGLDAGRGPRLWDALVLALAHQDLAPTPALEHVRAWAAAVGPMSRGHFRDTVHTLPSAESVLAATDTHSADTAILGCLRTAAAAYRRVEGVTSASARAATAAFHGLPPGTRALRPAAPPRPELSMLRIVVVGPGAAVFVSSASETRPISVPGAFTLGDRALATRQVRLLSDPNEPHADSTFTVAREVLLAHADGVVVLLDALRPDVTGQVLKKVRQSGHPFVVAFTSTEALPPHPAADRQRQILGLEEDTAFLGLLWANPRMAASAHDILQFLAPHIRTPSPAAHADRAPALPPSTGAMPSAAGHGREFPARAAPP